MGQQELFLTLGAITLFGIMSFSINQKFASNTDVYIQRQALVILTQVGQKYIERAKNLAFDEAVITQRASSPLDFHPPPLDNAPKELSERLYDDINDYAGFSVTYRDTIIGEVKVEISVEYIDFNVFPPGRPLTPANNQTYYKLMQVIVSNRYLSEPCSLSYIFTYIRN